MSCISYDMILSGSAPSPCDSESAVSTQKHIALVVEDNPEFQGVIAQALSNIGDGWSTLSVTNGADGFAALEDEHFNPGLVLVDLGLPDMSGVSVIRAARRRHPKVPIMVVSVLGGSENVLEAIRAGARGYLHKADSVISLAEAIKRVLEGEHPISASLARYLFNFVRPESMGAGEKGKLSPRELQLLRLLSQGFTVQEAAERMAVGIATAQTFARRIYQKLQVNSKVKALLAAKEQGLI